MALIRSAPPAVLPVSLDELKAHLKVTATDEDDLISACLDSAIDQLDAEGELGRPIIAQDWRETFARPPSLDLLLGMPGALSIVSVRYRDAAGLWQDASLADFALYEGEECPFVRSDSWPSVGSYPNALEVTYRAGFGEAADDVPAPIRQAIKILAAHYYEVRDLVIIGASVAEVPVSVNRLISKYRRWWS
jgi:uncharacterized phiE125 gp8 family phage protein